MGLLDWLFRRSPPRGERRAQPFRPTSQAAQPDRVLSAGAVFTPTQPKPGRRQSVRRSAELARILQALEEDKAHVVLYSERGRGKTSLSNLVLDRLRRDGIVVARHTCEAGSTFDSILRGLMQGLPDSLLAASVQPGPAEGCEAALPDTPLRPRDVVALPSRLACANLVCMVDEFDRIEDPSTRTRFADTIKQLSDRDVPLLFMIVGVSEDLEQILGQHPSIQRNVVGVHLPLFTDAEIAQLITRGGREAGYTFSLAAVARIVVLARGMPYMAQLLGLRLIQAASARDDTTVLEDDLRTAVIRLIADASNRVLALYASLTDHGRDAAMVAALRQVATVSQDPWGRLLIDAAADGSMTINEASIPAPVWARIEAAGILQPSEAGPGLFTFRERPLMHHALMLAARDVTLTQADAPRGAERLPVGTRPVRSLVSGD